MLTYSFLYYAFPMAVFALVFISRGFLKYEEAMREDLTWTHLKSDGFGMIAAKDGLEFSSSERYAIDDRGVYKCKPNRDNAERNADYLRALNSKRYRQTFFLEYVLWRVMLPWSIFTILYFFIIELIA